MTITTQSRMRAQREELVDTTHASPQAKRARNAVIHERRDAAQSQVNARGAADPQYISLEGAHFPMEILGLPHVLNLINALAMTPEEAAMEAIRLDDSPLLEILLDRSDCNASQVMQYAAAKGRVEAVDTLLPNVMGDGEFILDDSVVTCLKEAAMDAARNGHLDVVQMLLREIAQEREHRGKFVYYGYEQDVEINKVDAAWEILDEAAAGGHADIVDFVSGYAKEDEYRQASERSSALSSAISGGHADVVACLLGSKQYLWDVDGAFDEALLSEQPQIAEMIYEDYTEEEVGGEDMLVRLARTGTPEAVKYLYQAGHDDSDLVGEAFVSAVPDIETANFLWETGKVSSEYYERAIEAAESLGTAEALKDVCGKKVI